ncbi:MAG: hypothetical protein LIO81_03965 [Clostridiales bacterium]|nr:hypothetical protein [Clostridiales bacterium]
MKVSDGGGMGYAPATRKPIPSDTQGYTDIEWTFVSGEMRFPGSEEAVANWQIMKEAP